MEFTTGQDQLLLIEICVVQLASHPNTQWRTRRLSQIGQSKYKAYVNRWFIATHAYVSRPMINGCEWFIFTTKASEAHRYGYDISLIEAMQGLGPKDKLIFVECSFHIRGLFRRAIAEACRTREDWAELREIFTRSFKKYPLFEYVIPNQQKRLEFVRRFIDANYAVHAADKSALPLLIRKTTGIQNERQTAVLTSENRLQQIVKTKMETLGGVLFIKPAKDGIGWSTNPNEVYIRSYIKHGLREIDAEAFERLKTYEEWETENVTDDIFDMKVPMWNGMLCAIDPKYAGNGIGCEAFAECMKYLDKHNSISVDCKDNKATNGSKCDLKEEGGYTRLSMQSRNDTSGDHNSYDSFATKILRNLSLITHHPHHAFSLNTALSNSSHSVTSQRQHKEKSRRKTSSTPNTDQPLIALSHCPRAVQFHTRNGFRHIRTLPYYPPGDEKPAFDVYVLRTNVNKYL